MIFGKNPRMVDWFSLMDVSAEHYDLKLAVKGDELDSYETLTQRLWNQSLPLAQTALNTEFIQGMRTGTLNPECFGKYNVQDAGYLHLSTTALENVVKRSTGVIKEFAKRHLKSYKDYTKYFFEEWHLNDASAISLGGDVARYSEFVLQVSQEMDPIYLIIATLPCSKLWVWLGQQLQPLNPGMGVYREWIKNNFMTGDGLKPLEDFINEQSGIVDETKAMEVFTKCMKCEVGFFASATKK